jgi:hypothetical protein
VRCPAAPASTACPSGSSPQPESERRERFGTETERNTHVQDNRNTGGMCTHKHTTRQCYSNRQINQWHTDMSPQLLLSSHRHTGKLTHKDDDTARQLQHRTPPSTRTCSFSSQDMDISFMIISLCLSCSLSFSASTASTAGAPPGRTTPPGPERGGEREGVSKQQRRNTHMHAQR